MNEFESIIFMRSAVARILNCTPLTIAHREKAGTYPEPQRGANNYRYYSLLDVLRLQELTFKQIQSVPIGAELWNLGYKDPVVVERILNQAKESYLKTKENKINNEQS